MATRLTRNVSRYKDYRIMSLAHVQEDFNGGPRKLAELHAIRFLLMGSTCVDFFPLLS